MLKLILIQNLNCYIFTIIKVNKVIWINESLRMVTNALLKSSTCLKIFVDCDWQLYGWTDVIILFKMSVASWIRRLAAVSLASEKSPNRFNWCFVNMIFKFKYNDSVFTS